MSFEWQTDEEYAWEEKPNLPEPPRQRRRWPWALLLVVVLAGTAVFLLYRQLNQRIDTATDDIETDLMASYTVWQQAVQNRDENLFNSLLSGREQEWVAAQRALLQTGMVFDRTVFGLDWQPRLGETAVLSQTFSLDFSSVELTTLQNYTWNIDNGVTQTVQLARTDIYRLGTDRWLYAPPEPEFWGERQMVNGQLLTATYPARDEAIVQRLAADLEAKLVQLCNTPGYDCPPDAQVNLSFSTAPDSLTQATFIEAFAHDQGEIGAVWTGDETIVLPTPTLVGLPQDANGYIAFFRGYATQMLAVAVNDLIGWDCCQNVPFYRAALTAQLADLGVMGWPLAGTVSLPNDFSLPTVAQSWQAPFPENPTEFDQTPGPYVVVHYLRQTVGLSPSQMMRSLTAVETGSLSGWLTDQLGPPWTEALLNDAFRQYVTRWQASPTVLPALGDGLLLLCQNPSRAEQGIYYFDETLAAPELQQPISADEYLFFTGLPDGAGVAVVARESPTSQPETYLLFNSKERVDVDWTAVEGVTSRPPLAVPTKIMANGRYLLWTIMPDFANGNFFAVTDLAACQSGGNCQAIPVGGYPTWSPSGEQLISLSVIGPWWTEGLGSGLMLLREEPMSAPLNSPGFGASVFWLNETEFGYLTEFQNGLQQLVVSDVALSRPHTLITSLSLPELLPESDSSNALSLEFALPLPNNPRVIFILASDATLGHHLVWFDRESETVTASTLIGDLPGALLRGYRIAPDGRSLLIALSHMDETIFVLFGLEADSPNGQVIRLEGKKALPYHFYANWSSNGDWLVVPESGYLRLWHAGRDERLLNFPDLVCTNAVWVDRIEMVSSE